MCVVCLLITTAIPAETDEPIEVSFWIRTRVGPGNHVLGRSQIPNRNGHFLGGFLPRFACGPYSHYGWLGSRVVSVLDSGAEGPWFKSQPQRWRVTVLGKLFTPIVPLFTKQQNW